jgi:Fe-S oxidoreductase
VSLREAEHSGKFTLCCGAGGARMWMEEDPASRMNEARSKELLMTGAQRIVTACPFCTTMIGDGIAQAGQQQQAQVLDIAEIFALSCRHESAGENPPTKIEA